MIIEHCIMRTLCIALEWTQLTLHPVSMKQMQKDSPWWICVCTNIGVQYLFNFCNIRATLMHHTCICLICASINIELKPGQFALRSYVTHDTFKQNYQRSLNFALIIGLSYETAVLQKRGSLTDLAEWCSWSQEEGNRWKSNLLKKVHKWKKIDRFVPVQCVTNYILLPGLVSINQLTYHFEVSHYILKDSELLS